MTVRTKSRLIRWTVWVKRNLGFGIILSVMVSGIVAAMADRKEVGARLQTIEAEKATIFDTRVIQDRLLTVDVRQAEAEEERRSITKRLELIYTDNKDAHARIEEVQTKMFAILMDMARKGL